MAGTGTVQLIAEIGQNHNGDLALARELIRQAKANGADVAKFQVFDARRLFPCEGNVWFDYNCRTELTRERVARLSDECRSVGIEFIASVFDVERIGWLEDLGVSRYKVASRSVHDEELLTALGLTGKPLIVSLGHWTGQDFPVIPTDAPVAFLYCVARYPAALEDLRLESIDFARYAGFSDHTPGVVAASVALSRGARIIEKHFTLDRTMYGPDHAGSMTPAELRHLADFASEARRCLGR